MRKDGSMRFLLLTIGIFALSLSLFFFTASGIIHSEDAAFVPRGELADTKGGHGGQVIKVTNLNANGPGSFYAAVRTKGKRIVVFEVGGMIDLNGKLVNIRDPYLTIAGQTAPSPGITLINGGILITANDVIVQHLRVRPGNNRRKAIWSIDALSVKSASNIIIDHCSFAWASDENLSASGPRFQGKTPADWRKNTAHRITFSNNIIAEGLRFSTHRYGEHSKGTLIHDNVTDMLIYRNLYANNMDRNPYMKGGSSGVVLNNLIYNPGKVAMRYNLANIEWKGHAHQTGQWSIVGNAMELGSDSKNEALLDIKNGPARVYIADNIIIGRNVNNIPIVQGDNSKIVDVMPIWFKGVKVLKSEDVKESIIANVGARPWDRDGVDTRIINNMVNNTGRMIDTEDEVGGYPKVKETKRIFKTEEWDMDKMIQLK